jgi:hypothetical protein
MQGDPAAGGRIDNISQQVGIAGPDAFCFDPSGNMYFFGDGILWRMAPNQPPEALSRGRMDKTFGAIDLSRETVGMLWDDVHHGLHLYVRGSNVHYFWDARTDSFWKDQYPASAGPTVTMLFDANDPSDRTCLLGGTDGYVRKYSDLKNDDDGTAIQSHVRFTPLNAGSVYANSRISKVITKLDSSSNYVTTRIYAGNTPQEVAIATVPVWSRQVAPINPYATPRITGNSLLFEIRNDAFSSLWITGHTYAIGDTVTDNGVAYVAKTAHTSTNSGTNLHPHPGTPNTTDWTASAFYTWAAEGMAVLIDACGKTRHGRM